MACFLVTHQVTPEFSEELLLADEKKTIRSLPRELKWEMSWYLPEERILVCHWDAPTSQAVRFTLEQAGLCEMMPIIRIDPAVEVYPKRYVARRQAAHLRAKPSAKRSSRPQKRRTRELSGALGESIVTALQARSSLARRR